MCSKFSIDGFVHPLCRTPLCADGAFCATAYSPVMKKVIFRFKYKPFISDLVGILTDLFYESMIQNEAFISLLNKEKNIFCIPVPLYSKKLHRRGYNQSGLIANNLSNKFGWSYVDCLIRVRETKPQFGLTKKERIQNMKNAFSLRSNFKIKSRIKKTAFVVDDLLTTGITIREAAKVLKKNGFEKVFGLCLAGDHAFAK